MLARYHGLPVDGAHLRHEFSPSGSPFDDMTLLRAARSLGLRARRIRSRWSRLEVVRLPAIAPRRSG